MNRSVGLYPLRPGFWLTERVHWSLGILWNLTLGPALFLVGFCLLILAAPGLLLNAAIWPAAAAARHRGAHLACGALLAVASIALCAEFVVPYFTGADSPYETPQA